MPEIDSLLPDTLAVDATLADVIRDEWPRSSETMPELSELEGLAIIEEIGQGGMGVVYRAVQKALDREVAVKLLHPKNKWTNVDYERFYQEVTLAASLNHPNIAHIHWVKREGKLLYFVMEFIHGHSLSELLLTRPLQIEDLVHVFGQVCSGLSHAHERSIVHRDLKPGNILVENASAFSPSSSPGVNSQSDLGRAVLVDFGLAAKAGESSLNHAGLLMGTPAYMSPEQANGAPTDHRTDIYALGVTLFEALTGRVPFSAPTPLAMALKHISDTPPDPRELVPSIPKAFATLANRMLDKDPDARPQTAFEVRNAMEEALRVRSNSVTFPATPAEIPGLSSREVTVLAVAIESFLPAVYDQPLTRTSFVLESWLQLVQEAVAPHGGVIVKQEAALLTAVFNWPERQESHWLRAVSALGQLISAMQVFNRTVGSQLAFTAGLEVGEIFIGRIEGAAMPTCFGPTLDTAQKLSTVLNCGIGIVGPTFGDTVGDELAIEPLIGVADDLGAASRIDPVRFDQ